MVKSRARVLEEQNPCLKLQSMRVHRRVGQSAVWRFQLDCSQHLTHLTDLNTIRF